MTGTPEAVRAMLVLLGQDPDREGLRETPERVARFYEEWLRPQPFNWTTFSAEGASQMIVQADIPFYSLCCVGGTFVETPRGRVPISWLKDGDWIYTMRPETRELLLTKAVAPRVTRRGAALVRVMTDNDTVICTPDHRFLTTTGLWVEAKDLANGTRLASLYRGTLRQPSGAVYPTLIASRYTQWDDGLVIDGAESMMPEHRFVMAQSGHPLARTRLAITHHGDERVWNNAPENLSMVTTGEHNRIHRRTQKLAQSANRKRRAAIASARPDVREKRSASVKAHWDAMTPAARESRRAAMREGIRIADRNHVVFGVEAVPVADDVWCLTVPETSVYFTNGIASHNCEHHLLPFVGKAVVGYLPGERIVGLSKLARAVQSAARGFQNQERITECVADMIEEHLQPKGCGVVLRAEHLCMTMRGAQAVGSQTVTTSLRGAFRDDLMTRTEFLTWVTDRS